MRITFFQGIEWILHLLLRFRSAAFRMTAKGFVFYVWFRSTNNEKASFQCHSELVERSETEAKSLFVIFYFCLGLERLLTFEISSL